MIFRVVIAARYGSTRLRNKPLVDIAGKPMIQHIYENAMASGATSVLIATDHDAIKKVAEGFGANVCMTDPKHQSGTERIAEACVSMNYDDEDIIVNLQGDEPCIPHDVVTQVAANLDKHSNVKVATLAQKIKNSAEIFDPNAVKVVLNKRNHALYFSRAPIPWDRESFPLLEGENVTGDYYRHIGIYAYRCDFLQEYVQWETSPLEKKELLEQLRILWNGYRIHVGIIRQQLSPGVDTPEDLERVREILG